MRLRSLVTTTPLFLALRRRSAGPHRRGDRVGALPPAGHRDRLDYGLETAGGERPSAPLVLARIRREGQAALDGAEVLHPIAYESERKSDKEPGRHPSRHSSAC